MLINCYSLTTLFQVGGIKFKAFSQHTYSYLLQGHRMISNCRSVRRGKALEMWAYGNITPVGSRVAQGGRPADVYRPYERHDATTIDGIKTLFHHAHVSKNHYSKLVDIY
jgi:hypothetical protein